MKMACSSTDPKALWIDHAERSLFLLASELRRVPLTADTKRLHLRALELKRMVSGWRDGSPLEEDVSAVLEELEELARQAQLGRSTRSAPRRPFTCSEKSTDCKTISVADPMR
jgi:hypothetical protein